VCAAGIALGIALGTLSNVHAMWATALMVAAVLIVGAGFIRLLGANVGLVVLLLITALLDRGTFSAGRFDIRPEQIAALFSLTVLCFKRLSDRRFLWLRPRLAEAVLGAWFLVGLVSSLTVAPSRSGSLKVLALLVVSSLGLLLPPRLLERRRDELDQVVRWLLVAVAAEAAYGLLAYFLYLLGPTLSLTLNPGTGHLNAYGTLWEPNVFGAISSAGAVAWVYFGRKHFSRPWIGVGLCLSGTVVSFTRAAWLAALIVLVLSMALSVRRNVDLGALIRGATATLLVIGAVAIVDQPRGYSQSGLGGSVGNGTDVVGRLNQLGVVWSDLRHHLVFGGGIDSYGQRHVLNGAPEHLANLELAIANDTGLVGLLILALFLFAIVAAAWRCRHDSTVIGLAAVTIVIALTNQATETLELMITWLLLGLLMAAVEAARPVSPPATARTARDTGS